MKALFVAWQDPDSRSWIPVGRLTFKDGLYQFIYTKGAKKALTTKRFVPFGFMTDLNKIYVSGQLFPLFANRILPKSRPEYSDYLSWLGLGDVAANELEVLGRSGGLRATDTLQIIPCPQPTADNKYVVYFFSHGVRHLLPENQARMRFLSKSEQLYLLRDVQNRFDPHAIILRTGEPIANVGYVPRFYSAEFTRLIDLVGPSYVHANVEQVNADAPMQFRLLCRFSAPWPADFAPCAMEEFEPLVLSTATPSTMGR